MNTLYFLIGVISKIGHWCVTWPFKYFTWKRVLFAFIWINVGVGLVGLGLLDIAECVDDVCTIRFEMIAGIK